MKLGILCTMINGFGRRGYYNSHEKVKDKLQKIQKNF